MHFSLGYPPRVVVVLAVASTILIADQATKYLAVSHLTTLFERSGTVTLKARIEQFYGESELEHLARPPAVIIPSLWRHRYTENTGAAFSLFDQTPLVFRRIFTWLSMLLALGFVVVMAMRLPKTARYRLAALGGIVGGASGNFVDRVAHAYVIDFIDLLSGLPVWLNLATFNLADAGITCGAAVLLSSIAREALRR